MTIAVRQNSFAVFADGDVQGSAGHLSFPFPSGGSISDSLLASSPAALCLVDRHNRLVLVNDAMASAVGAPAEALVGRLATALFPRAAGMLARCRELARLGKPLPAPEVAWRGKHYQLCFNPLTGAGGTIIGFSIAAVDCSHRVRFEQRLRASRKRLLAITRQDHLTGLLNRRGLELRIGSELRRCCRTKATLGLLVIDIDCFKTFNDSFGHAAGDECLRAVASAIRDCLRRPADSAGRYGGEEFVVVLPDTDEQGAAMVAENCRRAVERQGINHPASLYGRVTVSIGAAAVNPQVISSPTEAIDAADRALYRAKEEGRNRVSLPDHRADPPK